MLTNKNITPIIPFLLFFFLACSNYEDGPKISLVSKTKRIARKWKVEYSIDLNTGIEHSADYYKWTLTFDKEGNYTQVIIYNNQQSIINGKWEFISDNLLRLDFNTESGEQIEFYTILRLTRKELWIADKNIEIHYYAE